MKLWLVLLVLLAVITGCKMENQVRWTTSESSLIPALTAANDFLQDRGAPILQDDANPNTHIIIDENFEQIYTPDFLAITESDRPECLDRFCESEKQSHKVIVNPSLLNWPDGNKEVTMAHEFGHALGSADTAACPALMNGFIGCQPQSLAECTESTC